MSANGNGNGGGGAQVGPGVIQSPQSDTRTLTHTGQEVDSENVDLMQNNPNSETPVIKWTVPKKFRRVAYAAGRHFTRGHFRSREDFAGHNGTTVSLSANLQPVAGEEDIDDQPFPTAVVANVSTGNQLSISDVDYSANELTLASDPGGDDIAVWPVINEGTVKYMAEDQFENLVGPLDPWGSPSHIFADYDQDKNETRLHLVGAGTWQREEHLLMVVDAPHQVVWEDSDYPAGQYASKLEQEVEVLV